LKEIGFRPEDAKGGVGEVDFLVLKWKRNVVEMNDRAGCQARKHFQNQEIDVASGADRMARVGKKDVVFFEFL
jgi:hypothetical protein